jgi:hypothetical protein
MASWFTPQQEQQQQQNASKPIVIIQGRPVSSPLLAPVSLYDNNTTTTNTMMYNNTNNVEQLHKVSIFGGDSDDDRMANKSINYSNKNKNYSNNQISIVAESMRQDKPLPQYRDVIWGILFYIHLLLIIVITIIYAPQSFSNAITNYASDSGQRRTRRVLLRKLQEDEDNDNNDNSSYNGNGSGNYNNNNNEDTSDSSSSNTLISNFNPLTAITLICIAGIIGIILSSLSMGFMIKFAEPLVKVALIFNIITFGILAILSLVTGSLISSIMLGVRFIILF